MVGGLRAWRLDKCVQILFVAENVRAGGTVRGSHDVWLLLERSGCLLGYPDGLPLVVLRSAADVRLDGGKGLNLSCKLARELGLSGRSVREEVSLDVAGHFLLLWLLQNVVDITHS